MLRSPGRWQTAFGRWVCRVGVTSLASNLSSAGQPVTQNAVYQWIAGRHIPRADRAAEMVRLSHGAISLEDVYAHREAVRPRG